MRWRLDAILPPAAAEELDRLGHDAISVLNIEMGAADDSEIFERAVTGRGGQQRSPGRYLDGC
ncbi:MAG: DUF5615 family PIN-like protein [Acidimicrobiales bacterium]